MPSARRAWWNWARRDTSVLAKATPKLPPSILSRLKTDVALPISSLRTQDMVRVVSGTKTSPMPNPMTTLGQATVSKSAERLNSDIIQTE
ncbi:MAG: hypothetical protein BWX71_02832 [Deltaproteobacteria bacterium ADurb.Bin072]|nr:MAG: hypothetical protein BWX71_02832 [Deltaproteobacteria bacterium ADurb.Bin072]